MVAMDVYLLIDNSGENVMGAFSTLDAAEAAWPAGNWHLRKLGGWDYANNIWVNQAPGLSYNREAMIARLEIDASISANDWADDL